MQYVLRDNWFLGRWWRTLARQWIKRDLPEVVSNSLPSTICQNSCCQYPYCPKCSFRDRKMHLVSFSRIPSRNLPYLTTSRLQRAKSCDESQYHRPLPRPWWWGQVIPSVRRFIKNCDDGDDQPGRDNDDSMRSLDDWELMMMYLVAAWLLRAEWYAFSPT